MTKVEDNNEEVEKKDSAMDKLLDSADQQNLVVGETIDGKVLKIKKNEMWIDLGQRGIGLVVRREIGGNRGLEVGADVTASVVDNELEEGHALLSLREAAKERGWDSIEEMKTSGEIIEINAYDSNRGGLLVEYEGVRGFLPVSQLSPQNYPRVSGSDKDEIQQKLNALVNKPLKVKILDFDKNERKLIFSEKEAMREEMQAKFEKLAVGDEADGMITGVVDFGVFVNVDGIEGLIHISELSWERVDDPNKLFKVGDSVRAKILAIDKDRLALSIKQTLTDPWQTEVKDVEKGSSIEGEVTRITPFGAFVQISPAVEALVHISEISKDSEETDPNDIFKVGEKKDFEVLEIDRDSRKISLKLSK